MSLKLKIISSINSLFVTIQTEIEVFNFTKYKIFGKIDSGFLLFGNKPWMLKDARYKAIKSLIESKGLHSLKEVFTIIPLTVVMQGMNIHYNTFRNRVNNTETLNLKDLTSMALFFEVEPVEIFKLALNDINSVKKIKKK